MLYIAFVTFAAEAIEVGACGDVVFCRIPELVGAGDVGYMEHTGTPFVVNVESVDGVGKSFHKVFDDKAVVDAVAVGSDNGGEFELVVDDDNGVLDGVGALDEPSAGTAVVGTCNEPHGVGTRDVVFGTLGSPFESWAGFNDGVVGFGIVFIVLDFPEVFVGSVVGGGVVNQ